MADPVLEYLVDKFEDPSVVDELKRGIYHISGKFLCKDIGVADTDYAKAKELGLLERNSEIELSDVLKERYPEEKGMAILGDVYMRLGNPEYSWKQNMRLEHENGGKEDRTVYLVKLPKDGLALVASFDEKSKDTQVCVYSKKLFIPSGLRLPKENEPKERCNTIIDKIHIEFYSTTHDNRPDPRRALGFDLSTGKFEHIYLDTDFHTSELDDKTHRGTITGTFPAVQVPEDYVPGQPLPTKK